MYCPHARAAIRRRTTKFTGARLLHQAAKRAEKLGMKLVNHLTTRLTPSFEINLWRCFLKRPAPK